MRRALGLAAVIAIACAACSLVVSLDDLAAHDGGSDAAPDVANDVIVTPDAGDAGASDAPFCKLADHSFCDDFDELPLGTLWSSKHVTLATLALDDAAVSPPNSLLASVPSSQTGNAYLQKDFTGAASHITCQLDARMDALQSVPIVSFEIALESTDPNRNGYNITLLHTSAKTVYNEWTGFVDGGQASTSTDLPGLPVGATKWTHVVVDMNFGAGSISITFDGASVLSTTLTPPPNANQSLLVGVMEYMATVATMHFDNVACDVTP